MAVKRIAKKWVAWHVFSTMVWRHPTPWGVAGRMSIIRDSGHGRDHILSCGKAADCSVFEREDDSIFRAKRWHCFHDFMSCFLKWKLLHFRLIMKADVFPPPSPSCFTKYSPKKNGWNLFKRPLAKGQPFTHHQSVGSILVFGGCIDVNKSSTISIARWWFHIFFIFTPTWRNDPIWPIFFKGVETTN